MNVVVLENTMAALYEDADAVHIGVGSVGDFKAFDCDVVGFYCETLSDHAAGRLESDGSVGGSGASDGDVFRIGTGFHDDGIARSCILCGFLDGSPGLGL